MRIESIHKIIKMIDVDGIHPLGERCEAVYPTYGLKIGQLLSGIAPFSIRHLLICVLTRVLRIRAHHRT